MAYLCQNLVAQVIGEVNVLDRDVFYLQYTPENEVSDNIKYQKWNTKLSIPPIRLHKLSIYNTLGLDVHEFNYSGDNLLTNTEEIELFYNINYSLFMNYKFSDKWSLNALVAPFVLSNFDGDFSKDDFDFNGNIYVERTFFRKKGGYFQVALGFGRLTLNGNTQTTPISQIKARLNKKWSFVVGLPNTYVKWDMNKKHSLKALGDINDFSANLSRGNAFSDNAEADKAVFTTVSAGLEYNFWITSSLGIMLKGTYPVWGDYEIRDSDNESFDFGVSFNQPFIGIGIKFNPIRNLQNSINPL